MPARRLPWVKLWPELMEREKVHRLTDSQYRTWTYCLMAGSQQPTRWRFNSVQHAAYVTRRPAKDVQALVDARFLDSSEDGLWIHDAHEYQDVAPSDVARERSVNGRPTPDDHPPNGRPLVGESSANGRPLVGESSANGRQNSASRTRGETEKGEGRVESREPSLRSGEPPRLRVVGEPAPKPVKRPTPVGTLLDKIKALDPDLEVYGDHGFTGSKLKENPGANLDLIAEAYVSFRRSEWPGSRMLRESGALAWVIGDLGGYVAWRASRQTNRTIDRTGVAN